MYIFLENHLQPCLGGAHIVKKYLELYQLVIESLLHEVEENTCFSFQIAFWSSNFTLNSPCGFPTVKIETCCSFMRCLAFTCYSL